MRPIYEATLRAQPPDKSEKVFIHRGRKFKEAVCLSGKDNPYESTVVKAKTACDLVRDITANFRAIAADLDRIEENRTRVHDVQGMMVRNEQTKIVRTARDVLKQLQDMLRRSQEAPEDGSIG